MQALLHSVATTLQQAITDPPLCQTPGHSWASLGQSLVGLLLLPPGSWCAQSSVCALQESVPPVLFKFFWLYGGVKGNLLQDGLCHTQVYCTQSPCRCSRSRANRVLPKECTGHSKHPLPTAREDSTHGHHWMVNTKIRLIIFFAAKDGEALYSQQKHDWELIVAQIMQKQDSELTVVKTMNSFLPN